MVPDVSRSIPRYLGDAVRADRRHQIRARSLVPPIGAGVWIEFEQGDPDYPIWTGGFWGSAAEVPALALAGNPASPSIVLQTRLQNTL